MCPVCRMLQHPANRTHNNLKITARILRIVTAELHRVYDNMLRRAQKCIDVQGDHFQHLL